MIQQHGGGWAMMIKQAGEAEFDAGVIANAAHDADLKLFGWHSTGDHWVHVRRYERAAFADDRMRVLDDDGTLYLLVTGDQKKGGVFDDAEQAEWEAHIKLGEAGDLRPGWDEFPKSELTLEQAAGQMGFKVVPPDWLPADRRGKVVMAR